MNFEEENKTLKDFAHRVMMALGLSTKLSSGAIRMEKLVWEQLFVEAEAICVEKKEGI